MTYNGNAEAFVAEVKSDGSSLVYAGYIGGSGEDWAGSIAVDRYGNAYVTGHTRSTDFPVKVGPDLTHNGNADAFVAEVKSDGRSLVYAGYMGGSGDDVALGIAVDGAGDAYVTGYTLSPDFPATVGPDLTWDTTTDAFVSKIHFFYIDTWLPLVILPVPAIEQIAAPEQNPSYRVAWSSVPGASGYTLEESSDASFLPVTTKVYTLTGVMQTIGSSGIERHFRVRANTAARGSTGWSGVQRADVRWEAEPNNAYLEATGPMVWGQLQYGKLRNGAPRKPNEYYDYFKLSAAKTEGQIKVILKLLDAELK